MNRILIVNADDCNLTSGVTEGILECHHSGIVTSTTWLVNLPVAKESLFRSVRKSKRLGVGVHLNITLGRPVSDIKKVRSLIDKTGQFKKRPRQLGKSPVAGQVALEYENQISKFRKLFSRKPTHLDTHHQLHDHPLFFKVLVKVAARHRLPIRRSRLMPPFGGQWKTTNYFFGDFSPSGHWRPKSLRSVIGHLPEGISEIMAHPGHNDADLRAVSSFAAGRTAEFRAFSASSLRKHAQVNSVKLRHFGCGILL